jgi:hypothetical protein
MKNIGILSYLVETDIGGNGYWWKKERSTFGGNVLRPTEQVDGQTDTRMDDECV